MTIDKRDDPIRARLDDPYYAMGATYAMRDALRAVLDQIDDWDEGQHTHLTIRRVIAEHLGVTDGPV